VIASLHGGFSQNRADATQRVIRALENPFTTWLGHPTGRLLLGRKGADLDMDLILEAAARFGKGLELNANPYRLDLDWRLLPKAKALGINIGIFPDAHSLGGIEDYSWGVLMARKGGLEARDVVNTKSLPEMEKWLARQRKK
jgi:DNA polymerase (family 10)